MAKYRNSLPQLRGDFFMTDGGIETTLIFHEGVDLPEFAAFTLLKTREGEHSLRKYFRTYGALASKLRAGLILETATWRASADWLTKLGYGANDLVAVNRRSVNLLEEIRDEFETEQTPIVISGCIGPRGDGYVPGTAMTASEAAAYHLAQIGAFATTSADLVTALTINYADEAIGIVQAAQQVAMPVVISFTVEIDGNLPAGQPLGDAIAQVDSATNKYAAYFMINCAHPTHFGTVVHGDEPWTARIRGLRANASRMSHAQLNDAPALDAGDPEELGREYAELKTDQLKQLNVMGGCCGTDDRHIERIAETCMPLFPQPAR